MQLLERRLVRRDVFENTDLVEFLAQELIQILASEPGHECICVNDSPAFGIEDEDAVLGGLEEPPVPHLGVTQGPFQLLPLGNVSHDHQDGSRSLDALVLDSTHVYLEVAASQRREFMLDHGLLDRFPLLDTLQQLADSRDVPVTVPRVEDEAPDRLLFRGLEFSVEEGVCPLDPEIAIEDHEGKRKRGEDGLALVERFGLVRDSPVRFPFGVAVHSDRAHRASLVLCHG
jgi:hypothetical protein